MQTLLAFTVAALVALGQTAAGTGAIAGLVVEEGTGTPIPGARVTVITAGPPPTPGSFTMPASYETTSDDQGRFTVTDLRPGRYIINFQKNGFATQPAPGVRPPLPVEITAGQVVQVERTLARGSNITGHVRDAAGEPLAEARVMAMRRMPGADRLLPIGGGAQSNDLGEFRLFGLPAGEYFVQAMPRPDRAFGPGPGTPRPTMAAPTFFPGVVDSAAAQSVFLSPGQTADAIDITLQIVPAFRVSGVVVDETGATVEGAMVMARPSGAFSMPMGPMGNVRTDSSGRFMIPNLQAGSYEVSAAVPVVIQAGGTGSTGFGASGGFTTFSSGIVGGVSGVVSTNGTTTQFRSDEANKVIVDVNTDVAGLKVVARRPGP